MKILNGEAILGDCLEEMKKIPDGSIDAIITDPPYGSTACRWDHVIPFEPMWKELKRIIKPNGAIALFGSEPFSSALRMSNIKNYKYDWVWKKERGLGFLNAKKMPLRDTENISIFYNRRCVYYPQMRAGEPYTAKNNPKKQKGTNNEYASVTTVNKGKRYPLTTLEFARLRNTLHPTQKPVALIEYLIKTYTNEGETVLDFTAGSFTTAIACENLGRKWICIEKDENYFQIGIKRLQNKL